MLITAQILSLCLLDPTSSVGNVVPCSATRVSKSKFPGKENTFILSSLVSMIHDQLFSKFIS